jgi:hypothetical protein
MFVGAGFERFGRAFVLSSGFVHIGTAIENPMPAAGKQFLLPNGAKWRFGGNPGQAWSIRPGDRRKRALSQIIGGQFYSMHRSNSA